VYATTMPTSSPEMSIIDRKILGETNSSSSHNLHNNHINNSHNNIIAGEKRKMMKTNSSSSASPTSTFELIPEESEARNDSINICPDL
jgi:hypothetical protein